MKICSLTFTIGWAAALVFGWLALAAPRGEPQMLLMMNAGLAALGFAAGMWSWIMIRRAI